MVDLTPRYRSYDPNIEPYDENLTDHRVAPYKFGQSARTDPHSEDSVPLFLSDYDGEPNPSEYMTPARKGRGSYISSRILAGVLASAAVAILVSLFSSDAARDIIANAKASTTAVLSAASAAVQPNPTQLTARDTQLKDPAQLKDPTRLSAPENQTPGVGSVATAAVAPTREEITTAYQSALQGGAPRAAAVAQPMIPGDAIHHLDPNEIASSLRRGDDLIASGDLAAARLVLRRAANAGDAHAAMTLAGTYDPVILEKLGVHGFVPDVAMARVWYEKAKKFGSAEAPQRLELLASKRQ
jgi:TPR repeat protein